MGNELKQKLPDYARLVTEKAFEAENEQRRKNIVTELEQAIRTAKSYGRPEDMTPRVPKMVETPVLDDTRTTQQKLADAQSAYDSYMGSQEREQNRQKANRDAFQEAIDRVFAVPGASMSDMPLSIASPLPKMDEKEQQLRAEVNYRKAQQQAEEDRAVMENDLATFEKWDKEDQLKLHKFIENGMGSFNAILGAANGSAQAEAYLAKKELEDKYGADVISRIATSVSRSKNQKLAKEMQEIGTQTAQEYPVLGSVASVPMNLIGSVAAPIGYLSEVIRGGKGQYNTLDPNNLGSIPGQYAGTVRQGVSQRIQGEDGNWLRTIAAIGYEGAMSAADSGARLAAGGFNPGISAGLAASQNFGSSLQQYSAQGATPEQAAMAALASSGIEYLTEKIPMDELLKVGKGGKVWKDILKQAFLVEPTTEEISLFANVAAEAAILGEKSDRSQRIGELISGGATYKEAKEQVNKELWKEAARTYAVSAVSGFAGAGGAAMGNRGTDVQVQQREQAQPELTTEQKTDNASQEETTSVNTDPTEHTAREQAVIDAYQESVDNDLVDYVQLVKENPGRKLPRFPLNPVNARAAADIQRLTGIDVSGNKTEIESRTVEHILKRHGENGTANHSMRDVNDIGRIQYVIDNYDTMENGGTTSAYRYQAADGKQVHAQTVLIKKKVNGTYFVVEAVPDTKKKTLYVLSAYMNKNGQKETAPSLVGDAEAYRFTSETKAKSDTVPINSITERGTDVNPEEQDFKSVGAAAASFSGNAALQDLLYEGNVQEDRKSDVRPMEIPKTDINGNPVSETAANVYGSQYTPDDLASEVQKATARGDLSYMTIPNSKAAEYATQSIERAGGWDEAYTQWHDAVQKGRAGAEVSARGAMLLNHAAQVYEQVKAAGDTAATLAAKKNWMNILIDIRALGTNTAQGLQAFRMIRELSPPDKVDFAETVVRKMVADMRLNTEVTIDEQLIAEYKAAETDEVRDAIMEKIQQNVASQIPSTWLDKFNSLRYTNMLGNLKTNVRNVLGNAASLINYRVKDTIAAGIENVVAKVNPEFQRTKAVAVSRELRDFAKADFQNIKAVVSVGGKYSQNAAAGSEFAQAVMEKRRTHKFAPMEWYRKGTNWMMNNKYFGDEAFGRAAYSRALAGYLKANGITPENLDTVDTDLLDKGRAYAIQQAQEATFHDNSAMARIAANFQRAGGVVGQGIMPFTKTPANVLTRAEEFSPLGIINTAIKTAQMAASRTNLTEKNGAIGNFARNGAEVTGADIVDSLSKTLTGTAIFALGMALYDMGMLTAGEDEDEEKAAFDKMTGKQPYSFVVGDVSYTLDWLTPTAMPLFMGAELMKILGDETELTFADLEQVITSIGDPLIQMSMLQGVSDSLDSIKYAENNLGQFVLNAALSYLTQGLTNTLAGQIERSTEENRMTTYIDKDSDMPQWIQRQLGKASQKLPGDYQQMEYRNAFGETQENFGGNLGGRLLYNLLSPGYLSKAEETALTEELNRLRDATGENVYPQAPEKSFNYTDTKGNYHKDYNLSAEELETMQKVQGETAADLLNTIIRSKDYRALTDAQKASVIDAVYSYAQEQGKQEALPNYHSTAPAWMEKLGNNKAAGIIRRGALSEIDRAIDDAVNSIDNGWKVTGAAKSDIEAAAKAFDKMSKAAQEEVAAGAEGETARFLELRLEGLSTDDYLDIAKAIAGLKPEAGKKEASSTQKWEAISKSRKLTDAEKDAAIKAYMTDYNPESSSPKTTELKYDYARQELGISPEAYTMIYRAYSEVDGLSAEEIDALGRSRKQEMLRRWEALGYDKNAALAFYNLLASTSKYQKTDVVSWHNSKGK